MNIIFLVLFFICSAIHLYHSWLHDQKKRRYTKPFLLILILLFYLTSTKNRNMTLVVALLTSWLGDVLLMPTGTLWFVSGGISFLVSHIFFILVYLPGIAKSALRLWLLPVGCIYLLVAFLVVRSIRKKTPKMMLVPMLLYLLANTAMNLAALSQLVSLRSSGALVAYIGAVLFFISDCCLYLVRYHENPDIVFKKHFSIMLTYLAGELLITVGMLMIGG